MIIIMSIVAVVLIIIYLLHTTIKPVNSRGKAMEIMLIIMNKDSMKQFSGEVKVLSDAIGKELAYQLHNRDKGKEFIFKAHYYQQIRTVKWKKQIIKKK